MQIEKFEPQKRALESKAGELIRALRDRKLIAIEYTPEACEQGVLAAQRDLAVVTLDRESRLLREVRAALARIADGTYGNCEACGEEIKPKRLDAVPWTRYCLRCQESIDRGPSPAGAQFACRLPMAA
jgi:DnaK suppressor protein